MDALPDGTAAMQEFRYAITGGTAPRVWPTLNIEQQANRPPRQSAQRPPGQSARRRGHRGRRGSRHG